MASKSIRITRDLEANRLLDQGMTVREISKALNMSTGGVSAATDNKRREALGLPLTVKRVGRRPKVKQGSEATGVRAERDSRDRYINRLCELGDAPKTVAMALEISTEEVKRAIHPLRRAELGLPHALVSPLVVASGSGDGNSVAVELVIGEISKHLAMLSRTEGDAAVLGFYAKAMA